VNFKFIKNYSVAIAKREIPRSQTKW